MCGVLVGVDLGDFGVVGVFVGYGVVIGVLKGGVDGVFMWLSGDEEGVGYGIGEGEIVLVSCIFGSIFLY